MPPAPGTQVALAGAGIGGERADLHRAGHGARAGGSGARRSRVTAELRAAGGLDARRSDAGVDRGDRARARPARSPGRCTRAPARCRRRPCSRSLVRYTQRGTSRDEQRRAHRRVRPAAAAGRHRRGERPAVPVRDQRLGPGRARHEQRRAGRRRRLDDHHRGPRRSRRGWAPTRSATSQLYLGGQCSQFTAQVGVDDETDGSGTVTFTRARGRRRRSRPRRRSTAATPATR